MNKTAAFILSIFLTFAAAAHASVTSALINKALDSQQNLDLNATLPQAISQIGALTGVRIEADPAVWELLPWGEQTTITAKIQNQTLRQALSAITQKLALEYELTDEAVELRPLRALRRLGRRATLAELNALVLLSSTTVTLTTDRPTVHELLIAIDSQLKSQPIPIAIENRASDAMQEQHIGIPRTATLSEALDDLSEQTTATWYPWSKTIVILPKHEQIRAQLGKSFTARYDGVDVSQVVLELLQRAGVDFTIAPSAYDHIPPAHRSVHLLLDNATIQQALDTIGGYTGLSFDISDNGVNVK